ncbi:hypothetical protein KC909_01540 [Candidatus Dojkabacteria bacterium]|uniref:Uncharacterized protein n=1 Tax=Candidatus Dojkabacteria bacterium TaxID=2099670 RepID=A0A955RJ34_9BACT|nr:hypothetical protein [Candidatus Dojkabacteria bacterium]
METPQQNNTVTPTPESNLLPEEVHSKKNNMFIVLLLFVVFGCLGIFVAAVFFLNDQVIVDPAVPDDAIVEPTINNEVTDTTDEVEPAQEASDNKEFSFELYFGSGANRQSATVTGMMPIGTKLDNTEDTEINTVTLTGDDYSLAFTMFYEGNVGPYEERVDIDDTSIDMLRIRTANESRYKYVNKDQFFEEEDFCNAPVYGNPPAPCGSDVLFVEQYNLILNVYCSSETAEGIAQCDTIMKDISIISN